MKKSKKVLTMLALVAIITVILYANLYLIIPIHSSNNTPVSNTGKTKIHFSSGVPIGESCEYYYSSAYVESTVTPYGIGINNNSTHFVYDITVDFSIWLQSNTGSLIIEKYSRKYYDSMPPFSSVYLSNNEIPTTSTQTYLYHIPPNCTYIKSTIDQVYAFN
jgi:hypothetical protein